MLSLVEKTWGYEIEIVNTPEYCGKELFVNFGKWSSMGKYHYHKIKDETFYILTGKLKLDYVGLYSGKFVTIKLIQGESFRIRPNIKHRFSTDEISGCRFIEFSTNHQDGDSYRCEFIDGEWKEDSNKEDSNKEVLDQVPCWDCCDTRRPLDWEAKNPNGCSTCNNTHLLPRKD